MIDSKILQRALDWNKYPKGIRIFLDTEVSSIQNTEVRDAILLDEKKQALAPKFYRGKKRKTWYDSSSNAIHVILSNIENPRELDRVILNEVLLRRGLAGLVGDDVMNRIANAVFDGQDEQTRKTFLSYVLGNNDMETDRIAAGKLYLRSQANQYAKAVTSQSKENAGKAWYSMVRKYIRPYAPQLFSFLSEETSLPHIIGAGIRAHASYDSYSAKMSEVSSSRVRDEIVKLYNRELEGRTLDLGRYIHLGRPGDILLASAPWTKTCPVILPLVSLYENMEDGRHERYITSIEDIKKEKHPFSLLQILNLRDELESPLAVFKSVKRDRGLVIMLPSKGGKTADASKMEHFAVPISLQEINYTENSGLRKSYGSGKWVNYIHSIYPKNDSGYLCWLSVPGLCSYLSPSFEEKWLKPAKTRLEERFEHLFKAEGIKKPSAGEIKEILNNLSADDYIDIKSKLAKFQDLNEAGLPKVYSVYRDVLESATKIVKEFENPKIISQKNIEFSIQNEDLSPRMMMEKVLDKLLVDNPEKLRRIAYLCVKGSPAFGDELPPVNPVSYVADMQYGKLKETIMEHWPKLSEDARISIHAEFPELPNLSLDENTKYEDARKLFFTLTLDDKCRFMGFDGKNDAWKDLMNWHPLGGPDWELDEDMLSGGIDDMFKQATAEEVIEKYIEWKNDGFKASETYALAKDITMFMVNKLNEHGIKTVMVPEEKAREILEKERGSEGEGLERIDFSVRDIMNLSYTWNGEEVSMRGFAEQFMSEIKQKDRTMEDAERIAKAFIEAVKADPEKAGMKMLKAENMANAFRFKLPDGTIYTPEHPLASSPEYETQKGLWLIYENVLGRETMNEFVGLLSKKAPMSAEERKRYSELESKVNGSDLMQRSLEVPASKVNENRVRDIRNLIQYFEGNEDYTWTEKALIVKGAMSFGYSEKKEFDQTKVEIKNISDNNSVAVPVIGGEAAAIVEGLRKGLNFKDALIQARISLSKESKRSVERNFTGWKVYRQSDKEEDAVILNQDVAGTGWCTGGAVSTARSHLSGGDFHVYYEAGEPLIAIRTENGRMAEPPRGAHEGQFCTDREEQIAFDYIRSGNGIIAGNAYIADIEDIRRIMSPDATPLDAFLMPVERRYENGEFGGDTNAWGKSVEQRIAELIPDKKEERWKLGLYYGYEIEDACKNGNAIVIKGSVRNGDAIMIEDTGSLTLPKGVTQVGDIELFCSASLTLSEGVTQVGVIYLNDSASLTLSEGVTQVEGILLYDSVSLTLPKSVTKVWTIDLGGSASLTLSEGVTQVGRATLSPGTSITFPDGFVLKPSEKDGVTRYSAEEMNRLLSEHQKKQEFRLADGTIYGYQQGDTIYLTPAGINPNTPIHEYAHLWAKVYEKLRPEEWESLKEELKALPQWKEIAESESYSFIESDENRLAGEVLATIVGNKGEELMLSAARDTLEEGKRTDESVAKGAEYFRQLVTDMAVKDVFDAEGMERTGEVTLKVLKDFAEGKGVKVSKEEGKKLAAMAEFERNRVKTTEYISKSNARFNEELQKQIDGEFDSEPHTYNLGYPGPILRSTGIPNLPIQVTSTKLYEKSNSDKHKYALDEIKDLVKHINTPVAVFSYGDGTLAQNIIIDIEHDNSHFLVGMSLNVHIKGSALEINSIRNVFPKDNYKWMEWIQEGKSRYMDKEKIKVLIAQQRTSPADVNHLDLDFVANIVEKFENPKVDEKYFIIDNWHYYGVFLDDRAQSIIDREFRELIPSGWKKHADHVTVLYNDYSNDMIAKGRSLAKTLGQERTIRIVALGKSDTAIALMVEGVETENKIAHITLATSPDGKPVDSNFITEWKPVEQIDISGRLGLSYKGKKYFEVLSENDVVNFQINKNNMAKQVQQQSSEKKDATVAISDLVKDADFKTLQKAALFAAWETREGNPYEFVVDMSRNELAEFLANAEKKLNDEDRDIVSKILSHEPGYGEDYVEKQMSFRPDIEKLLVDDLTVGGDVLDRAFFYLATKDMNDAQLQQLRDNVRKKAVDFYSNMDKKNDLPGHKDTEKFVDKQLHSWFRPWTRLAGKLEHQLDEIHMSDSGPVSLKDIEATARAAMADPAYANFINSELKGWIRNRCADYGLDYTKLPEDLQREELVSAFKREWPELVTAKEVEILQGIKNGSDIVIRKEGNYTIPADVTVPGNIMILKSCSLTLPEGVTQMGNIFLSGSAYLALPEGVTRVGNIVLSGSAYLALPEGVTRVGNIVLQDSPLLAIPEGLTQVGNIFLSGSASLTLPEGVTRVGNIRFSGSASLTLQEGVTQVGNIRLSDSASLTLPEGVTQVGNIDLLDSTSLTLPEGVTQVGNIWLIDSASLTLPESVTQVGRIGLSGSTSLTIPDGVTQVGDIELHDYTSLTIPEGVTQVGGIVLSDSTSLTLPEGVTQVGSIYLFDSSSLTIPEGLTQVGNILLRDDTSLTVPKGVTQVGDIELHGFSSLTLPEGVTQVGDIELWKSASLTLPEGVTQVGYIHVSSGTSITFPDGYVLHTEENKTFSPEEFNALLAEHQIEHQMNIKATLDKKSTVAKAMYKKNYDTLTRDAILAHIDKITALYPQYPQEPTKVSLKPDGSIVRQYGEFEYEQIKGGFERSKNLVLVEELDGETLQRKALYSMSSDSYGEHPNGPYVRFWDNGNIRSYEDCSVRVGSDNEFESDMLSFTREGIIQEKIPGDYPIEPFLEDITNEYMKTMTPREGLEPNATANKIDSALLSTWFISLTLEDKMRVFGYYHNNPENENSPIGDDIEKLEAAYKEAVEAPHDVPEVEEIVIRKGIEERLTSAFESLSDESKGQIYRETVESGIPGLNQTQRSILNDAHTAKMSEELKTLAKECAARKSFFDGFDYDIGVLNTEKMSDSELYSFVSKNLSVLSIEQLAEAQRILEKWRNFNDMMQKNDAIDKRFSKYFAPHCEAVLERTGLDLNELHQSLPQKEFARLMRGQEVLIDGTVNTKEGPSNGLWSFRISPAKPGPDNPGFSFYLYPVKYHDGPNGKIPEHKTLPKGEDLVIKGRHFKAGSDEVEQWRLAGRGIVLETPSGLELVTPGKYDSTVGIARSVSYIEKRLTSLEHADLHLRPLKDDGSIKKEKTKGFQIGSEDIPKLARGEEVVLTTKDGVKACVRYDCGENNLIEVVPFAIAKRMELRDELKQKDKVNLEKVIKEVGRPASKNLDNNIRKK